MIRENSTWKSKKTGDNYTVIMCSLTPCNIKKQWVDAVTFARGNNALTMKKSDFLNKFEEVK